VGAPLSLRPRALVRGALWTVAVHVGLLALWPLVRLGYAPLARALAQLGCALVDPLPGHIDILFVPGAGGQLAKDVVLMDTVVKLLPHGADDSLAAVFGASTFFHGWYPITVLLALFAAATPLPWRARRRPFLWALLALHLALLARLMPSILYCYSVCTIDGRPALELGAPVQRALYLLRHVTWLEVTPNYLVPLLIFGVCVFGPRSVTGVARRDPPV